MSKEISQGWIKYDNYGTLVLKGKKDDYSGEAVAELFEPFNGKEVSVHYYITDKPVTEAEALEASVVKDLGGETKAEFILDAYSSWTVLEHKQKAVVGGHNLIDELDTYEGKYCTLVISTRDSEEIEL